MTDQPGRASSGELLNAMQVGGVYAYPAGFLRWGYVKVLAIDDRAVHVRYYRKRTLFRRLVEERLQAHLGAAETRDASVPHAAVSRETAGRWPLAEVLREGVEDAELAEYRAWREADGPVVA